jgi:hypothetical protein
VGWSRSFGNTCGMIGDRGVTDMIDGKEVPAGHRLLQSKAKHEICMAVMLNEHGIRYTVPGKNLCLFFSRQPPS